ncbi:MAG: GGDEF domain-containing protein [Solirubrobacteraceae bacterium]|nr:GGDEF domain-containing protein [Solirubrobacteraceae bacterium]
MLGSKRIHDLVPLNERTRMMEGVRAGLATLVIVAWLTVPATRGTSFLTLALAAGGYVAVIAIAQRAWIRQGLSLALFFGVAVMLDAAALAWASYGTSGVDSPLRLILILQLITVSLVGSFRLGLKLALFQVWMLLGAVYLQELGVRTLGGERVSFGSPEFRTVGLELALTVLVAAVTTGFAAVNERELRRRRSDVEELAALTMRLDDAEGPLAIAGTLLAGIEELHGTPRGIVVRRCEAGDYAVLAARGMELTADHGPFTAEAASLVEMVRSAGRAALLVHRQAHGDALLTHFPDGARLALVPLAIDDSAGVLIVEHPPEAGSRMQHRILALLSRYAAHAAIVIRNAELLERVRALATTDGLTGLPNRRHLDEALDRACAQVARGHGSLGVLMIDVDHFKKLNDTHGHQVGDEVLKHVAKVLDSELRAGDMVARYGGEEFTVVMPGAQGVEAKGAAERLRCAIELAAGPVDVTVSVGVAWAPLHGTSRVDLVASADAALYEAKQRGRNCTALAKTIDPSPHPVDAQVN